MLIHVATPMMPIIFFNDSASLNIAADTKVSKAILDEFAALTYHGLGARAYHVCNDRLKSIIKNTTQSTYIQILFSIFTIIVLKFDSMRIVIETTKNIQKLTTKAEIQFLMSRLLDRANPARPIHA